jgi:hypothetical protein
MAVGRYRFLWRCVQVRGSETELAYRFLRICARTRRGAHVSPGIRAPSNWMHVRIRFMRVRIHWMGASMSLIHARIQRMGATVRFMHACIQWMGTSMRWMRACIQWMRTPMSFIRARIQRMGARMRFIHVRIKPIGARVPVTDLRVELRNVRGRLTRTWVRERTRRFGRRVRAFSALARATRRLGPESRGPRPNRDRGWPIESPYWDYL